MKVEVFNENNAWMVGLWFNGGFPKSRDTPFGGGACKTDYSIFGWILGSPYFGKLPITPGRENAQSNLREIRRRNVGIATMDCTGIIGIICQSSEV